MRDNVKSLQSLNKLISSSEQLERWAVAAKALENLCEIYPQIPRLRHKQALLYLQAQEPEKAKRCFQIAFDGFMSQEKPMIAESLLHVAVKAFPGDQIFANALKELNASGGTSIIKIKFESFADMPKLEESELEQLLRGLDADLKTDFEEGSPVDVPKTENDIGAQLKALSGHSKLLRNLPERFYPTLIENSELHEYQVGEDILLAGAASPYFMFVVEGAVQLVMEQGAETEEFCQYKEGDSILPIGRSKEEDKSLHVVACETTKILNIPWSNIDQLKSMNREFAQFLTDQELNAWTELLMLNSMLFKGLSLRQIRLLKSICVAKTFKKSVLLIEEGTIREPMLYFLVDGIVGVYRNYRSNHRKNLKDLFPGTFFGERGFLTSQPSIASVVAESDVQVLMMSRSQMDNALAYCPEFTSRLSIIAEERIQDTLGQVLDDGTALNAGHIIEGVKTYQKDPVALTKSELFKGIDEEKIKKILAACERKTYPAYRTISKKGAKGDKLYIIKSGALKEFDYQEGGEEINYGNYPSGHALGEYSYLSGAPNVIFLETLEDTELYELSFSKLKETAKIIPALDINIKNIYYRRAANRMLDQAVFLKDLNDDQKEILSALPMAHFSDGDVLIAEREKRNKSLFIIISGDVQIKKAADGKKAIVLAQLTRGQVFGEAALITGLASSASVHAVGAVSVFRLSEDQMPEILEKIPSLASYLVELFRERVNYNIEAMISSWRSGVSKTLNPKDD